jgi:hypothetical protein
MLEHPSERVSQHACNAAYSKVWPQSHMVEENTYVFAGTGFLVGAEP